MPEPEKWRGVNWREFRLEHRTNRSFLETDLQGQVIALHGACGFVFFNPEHVCHETCKPEFRRVCDFSRDVGV